MQSDLRHGRGKVERDINTLAVGRSGLEVEEHTSMELGIGLKESEEKK